MSLRNNSLQQKRILLLSAMVSPLLHAASDCNWSTVVLVGGLCTALCFGLDVLADCYLVPLRLERIQGVWSAVVLSQLLMWVPNYWEGSGGLWTPLILLALASWTAGKGLGVSSRAAGVLSYFLLLIIGGIFLASIKEVQPENLLPQWQLSGGKLIVVFLIPALMTGKPGNTWKTRLWIALIGVLASVLVIGVLGMECALDVPEPFYELSRSIRFLSVTKRFESLASASLTIGMFLTSVFLLTRSDGESRQIPVAAIITAVLLILRTEISDWILVMGCLINWVLLPGVTAWKNNLRKTKKGVDK